MDLLIWTFFGVINGLILYAFENTKGKRKVGMGGAIMMSVAGALSGGTLAYIVFGGTQGFNLTLLLVLFFEVAILTLLSAKSGHTHYRA
jgi:uncharacterized membrane protein YeaQ/YmgE (transglycosylase-associated protein family)